VLIKVGLRGMPALTFAGLRYGLAFVCLIGVWLVRRPDMVQFTRQDWLRLAGLGVLYYAITQGTQFVGLSYLPAVTVSLILNFTAPLTALLGLVFLGERSGLRQWGGIGLFVAGALVYFYPADFPLGAWIGLGVMLVGVGANAASSVLGRGINRGGRLDPLTVTTVSMGVGAALLLAGGAAMQGFPELGWQDWLIVFWLALVNTALAFTLWNRSLQTLTAVESSVINGTMLVQIAVLAMVFLGESLNLRQVGGLILAGLGALLVQLRPGA
jgi:drug/metabolite transporter (DMT)-like permease